MDNSVFSFYGRQDQTPSSHQSNPNIVFWVVVVGLFLLIITPIIIHIGADKGSLNVSTSPELKQNSRTNEAFRNAGYNQKDADIATDAVLRFHEKKK